MSSALKASLAVGVVALAGIAIVSLDGKSEAKREGNYIRVRKCVEKSAARDQATLPEKLARAEWPDGGKPKDVECFWLTVLNENARPVVVATESAPDNGLKTEVFAKGEAGGFDCACPTGVGICEKFYPPAFGSDGGWRTAPAGNTIEKDMWRGAGCFQKSCVEAGSKSVTSTPSECPER